MSEPDIHRSTTGTEWLDAAVERNRAESLAPALKSRGLGAYSGYGELLARVRQLARPGVELHAIGESVSGEPICAISCGNLRAPRTSVVVSGLHPMEWIAIEVTLALLKRLVDHAVTDRRIVVVPIANPDGLMAVENDLRRARRRWVRHNRAGVDLNRNFPSFWNRLSAARIIGRALHRPGPAPASEPEVRAITSFFKGAMVDRAVSLHSFGGAVLYPYGGRVGAPPDAEEHQRWAQYVARLADPKRPYRAVQCSRWLPGFTIPGMELDYFHDQHGALSLLVECTRGGLDARPQRWLEPFAWYNPERPDRVAPQLASALEPFVRGLVHVP